MGRNSEKNYSKTNGCILTCLPVIGDLFVEGQDKGLTITRTWLIKPGKQSQHCMAAASTAFGLEHKQM